MIISSLMITFIQLKFPDASFTKDIIIQDDGQGAYIKEWNLDAPKPTQKDLDTWATEFDLPYRQKLAVSKRVYPSVQDQLDMLYKDKVNATNVWVDTITAIKAAHVKPTE